MKIEGWVVVNKNSDCVCLNTFNTREQTVGKRCLEFNTLSRKRKPYIVVPATLTIKDGDK